MLTCFHPPEGQVWEGPTVRRLIEAHELSSNRGDAGWFPYAMTRL
jgi:hypothetical protein